MFCYSCGAELPEGAHFCPRCGQSCSIKANSEIQRSISFEDELSPISDVLPKAANKEPQGYSPKTYVSDSPLDNGSPEWRIMNENGSGNTAMEFFDDTLFATAFIPDGDTLRMPLMADGKMIVPGPVGAFHIGRKGKLIFYLTEKYELMACDFHGKKTQKIAGGNGDRVLDFALNENQLFVRLQGKGSNISIFQISQTLDSSRVLKKAERLRGLAADQDFLYYIEGTALTQYDLKTGSEKIILNRIGINTFQLYKGHLVLTVSDNSFSTHDEYNQILLIDPARMLQRTVAHIAAKSVNCCWDHVFYIDSKSERIWTVPLVGGSPHLLRNKAADSLNLACGCLYFIDCASVEFTAINLSSGKELPSNSEEIPKAASEAIKFSLLNQGAEHYKGYTLNQALLEGVSNLQELNSKSELFDYAVFLTLPQLNKKREDVPALLKAAGYQQKPGSEPIVFVDSTISHKRGKGFIIATDGIYTDKTFFPYDYTFDCEREGGPQNIRLRTYEKVRFGKEKRTLDISCPMFKSGLEDLAELIYTIYAFSYFMVPTVSDGYLLPKPKDLSGGKQPEYIKVPKKSDSEKTGTNTSDATHPSAVCTPAKDSSSTKTETSNEAPSKLSKEEEKAKEKEYTSAIDHVLLEKPGHCIVYNILKFAFEVIVAFVYGLLMHGGHSIWAVISIPVTALLSWIGCICIQTVLFKSPQIEQLEGKYKNMGINTAYTPIGLRGAWFWLSLVLAWGLASNLVLYLFPV